MTDLTYPRNDEIWESTSACSVNYRVQFAGFTDEATGSCSFPAKERVRITDIFDKRPSQITFVPLRLYNEMQERIPQQIRSDPRYVTYRLFLDVGAFEKEFTRIK
jgi:hypothetical protein